MHRLPLCLGLANFISEAALAFFRRAPKSANIREADHSTLRSLWIVILASIFIAIEIEARVRATTLPHLEFFIASGVVIFLFGIVLRWWSIIRLGRFFTVNVAIAGDHELVETGPYRFVRHPSYTGALLALLGFGLSLGNWVALLALMLPIIAVFVHRMNVEERTLLEALGENYASYMRRTKRLLPLLY